MGKVPLSLFIGAMAECHRWTLLRYGAAMRVPLPIAVHPDIRHRCGIQVPLLSPLTLTKWLRFQQKQRLDHTHTQKNIWNVQESLGEAMAHPLLAKSLSSKQIPVPRYVRFPIQPTLVPADRRHATVFSWSFECVFCCCCNTFSIPDKPDMNQTGVLSLAIGPRLKQVWECPDLAFSGSVLLSSGSHFRSQQHQHMQLLVIIIRSLALVASTASVTREKQQI